MKTIRNLTNIIVIATLSLTLILFIKYNDEIFPNVNIPYEYDSYIERQIMLDYYKCKALKHLKGTWKNPITTPIARWYMKKYFKAYPNTYAEYCESIGKYPSSSVWNCDSAKEEITCPEAGKNPWFKAGTEKVSKNDFFNSYNETNLIKACYKIVPKKTFFKKMIAVVSGATWVIVPEILEIDDDFTDEKEFVEALNEMPDDIVLGFWCAYFSDLHTPTNKNLDEYYYFNLPIKQAKLLRKVYEYQLSQDHCPGH